MKKNNKGLANILNINLAELIILERINDISDPSVEIKKEQIKHLFHDTNGSWEELFNDKKLLSMAKQVSDNSFLSELDEIFMDKIKEFYSEQAKEVDAFFTKQKSESYIKSTTIDNNLLTPGEKTFTLPSGKTVSCSDFGFSRILPQSMQRELETLKSQKDADNALSRKQYEQRKQEEKQRKKAYSALVITLIIVALILFGVAVSNMEADHSKDQTILVCMVFNIIALVSAFIIGKKMDIIDETWKTGWFIIFFVVSFVTTCTAAI